MYENIKFNMDQAGARVENEAVIGMETTSAPPTIIEKPKNFILNKPYWVIMQRQNSQNPYFLLGINNSELMEKLGGEVPQSNREVPPENVDASKANDLPNVSESTETPEVREFINALKSLTPIGKPNTETTDIQDFCDFETNWE